MQTYDYIMIAILVVTTVLGAWRGMAWQVATLASLIVSFFIAIRFSASFAPYLSDQAPWNRFLAMLILYILSSLVIWLLFSLVANFIERLKLREFDQMLGAIIGFAKGVLFCIVITFFVVALSGEARRKSILESNSGYFIGVLLDKSHDIMPNEIHEVLRPYLNRIEREFDSTALGQSDDAFLRSC